ncbi:MAG: hypothetical protein EXQ86_11535 [Rhodospirillales bacterium]|nr:hypothetical protein [Rhodospirillales bacterium]
MDRGRYDAFATVERRRLEQRLPQLADAVAIRVRAAMAPIFVEVEGRVPRFADWVFDWWTSWILLGRAMRWTWDGVATGHVLTMPDKVQAQLIAAIEMRYVELVLQPAVAELKLTDALDRVVTSLRDDLAEECRGHETALRAFIATAPARVERLDAGGNWVRAPDWNGSHASVRLRCGADVGAEDALMRDEISNYRESRNINAPVNEVILRLSRPFATKLISFVVLPVIVAALIGGFALPLLGVLPNVISGVIAGVLTGAVGAAIIGFSASASVDWVLTRTDERINRAGFEVQVRRAVITGRRDFEGNITDAQRRLIERQLLAIAAAGPAQAAHP